ncbi:MAG TPA: Type 1 glutamine amidotransferase-like domain-containing protein [Polyangiaceae bacterium]|jgi:dipeptidase E|nr:Type 1 glutamine amidotransferase-like domain-containing protein [Polyangiaceae bacterium]
MAPKLLMYSNQSLPHSDPLDARLLQFLAPGTSVGYIPASPDRARRFFSGFARHYERLGIALQFFGLEDEFQPEQLAQLLQLEAIHLSGGNTFRFLHWLRARNLVPELQKYVAQGGVLIGVSAGAILMTRDIRSAAICGDAPYPAPSDPSHSDATGLGLLDFVVLPHFDGSPAQRAELARLGNELGSVAYGVPDGSGIVVDGSHVEPVGNVTVL